MKWQPATLSQQKCHYSSCDENLQQILTGIGNWVNSDLVSVFYEESTDLPVKCPLFIQRCFALRADYRTVVNQYIRGAPFVCRQHGNHLPKVQFGINGQTKMLIANHYGLNSENCRRKLIR